MKSLSLAIIAICYLANTAYYESDNGGTNVYFGKIGRAHV